MKGENMKYILIIVVLVAVIFTSGCIGDPQGRTRYCGFIQYDIYENFCCGSTLYASQERSSVGCCNEISFNPTNQFCCNGVIYSSRTTQHCCKGKVEPGGGTWSDCGGQCYSTETQVCCRGVVYDKKTNHDCCGSAIYDITNQGCCNKETVFSTTTQHCCKGKVESGGGYWFECGSQCYNMDTQSCCNGEIKDGVGACPQHGGTGDGDYVSIICKSFGDESANCKLAREKEMERYGREMKRLICPSCG